MRHDIRDAVLLAIFFTFLGLKLSKAIDWSWWWVTSPLWGPVVLVVAVVVVILAIALVVLAVVAAWDAWSSRRDERRRRQKEPPPGLERQLVGLADHVTANLPSGCEGFALLVFGPSASKSEGTDVYWISNCETQDDLLRLLHRAIRRVES